MVRKEEDRRRGREGGRDGMELPGRYIGGIFQIYYPLICYIGGGRERRKEGELHYFFVVLPHVKFVGSSIHTGNSGLCIDLHSTSLALFLFRHSLGRRVRREISKISSTARRLLSKWVIVSSTSLLSLPATFRVQVKFAKSGVKSEKCIFLSLEASRAFKVPSPQPRFINRSCRPNDIISDGCRQHFTLHEVIWKMGRSPSPPHPWKFRAGLAKYVLMCKV